MRSKQSQNGRQESDRQSRSSSHSQGGNGRSSSQRASGSSGGSHYRERDRNNEDLIENRGGAYCEHCGAPSTRSSERDRDRMGRFIDEDEDYRSRRLNRDQHEDREEEGYGRSRQSESQGERFSDEDDRGGRRRGEDRDEDVGYSSQRSSGRTGRSHQGGRRGESGSSYGNHR